MAPDRASPGSAPVPRVRPEAPSTRAGTREWSRRHQRTPAVSGTVLCGQEGNAGKPSRDANGPRGHPHRNGLDGGHRRSRRQVLGCADAAVPRELHDRDGEDAAAARQGTGRAEEGRSPGKHGPGHSRQGTGVSHRRRGAGSHRWRPGRPLSARRLADRLRHPDQHECQRGDLQPRDRDAGRTARFQDARSPQRPREHGAVLERHVPDRRCTFQPSSSCTTS